jgi:hypothetical protein
MTKEDVGRERLASRKASEPQQHSMERRSQVGATLPTAESAADRRESVPKQAADPKPSREQSTPSSKQDEAPAGRRAAKRKRTSRENGGAGPIRYFLTKPSSNGTPELDQEMPDEQQALITALKQDRHFVSVKEWRAKVDIKKGSPVIEKDPVVRE